MKKCINDFKEQPRVMAARTRQYGKLVEEQAIEVEGEHYRVEIRYGSMPREIDKHFTLICAFTPVTERWEHRNADTIIIRGPNANDLLKQMQEQIFNRVKVTWKPVLHILVQTHGSAFCRVKESALGISYAYALLGTRPDGSFCHRLEARRHRAMDTEVREGRAQEGDWFSSSAIKPGKPLTGPDGHGSNAGHYGILPWSQDREDRLNAIIDRLSDLAKVVRGMITGDDEDTVFRGLMQTAKITGTMQGPLEQFESAMDQCGARRATLDEIEALNPRRS